MNSIKKITFQKLTEESTCEEGPVVRQPDYEFMNIESYNNIPRFQALKYNTFIYKHFFVVNFNI